MWINVFVIFMLAGSVSSCGVALPSSDVADQTENASPSPTSAELITFLKQKNLDKVRELVSDGADLNSRDAAGYTVLQIALRANDDDLIEFLLKNGADPNQEITIGSTLLETALLRETDRTTFLLLKSGTDVNARTAADRTILIDAVIKGRVQIASYLIENGADVNFRNSLGRTALFYAVDIPELIELLLRKGADPALRDVDGESPLFSAIRSKNLSVVRILAKAGTPLHEGDSFGWIPLQEAYVVGCKDIVDFLRSSGAELG